MPTTARNIEGSFYPRFDCGWGGCAEELFHYTSRYYIYTEAFLRNLSDDRNFSMASYNARQLSSEQKKLMAAVLACKPDKETAATLIKLVTSVRLGKSFVSQSLAERFRTQIDRLPKGAKLVYRRNFKCPEVNDLSPLDPFLNIAERLRLPVAVKAHHVEVSLGDLAEYLDSPISSMRLNLQNAVLRLHASGYLLRNHPGLTHEEAKSIADEDAV